MWQFSKQDVKEIIVAALVALAVGVPLLMWWRS